jgi:hypothetical protein
MSAKSQDCGDSRQLLLRNGSANMSVARQWFGRRHVTAAAPTRNNRRTLGSVPRLHTEAQQGKRTVHETAGLVEHSSSSETGSPRQSPAEAWETEKSQLLEALRSNVNSSFFSGSAGSQSEKGGPRPWLGGHVQSSTVLRQRLWSAVLEP